MRFARRRSANLIDNSSDGLFVEGLPAIIDLIKRWLTISVYLRIGEVQVA